MTETQRRAYILADNKLSLNAGWDNEMLAVELSELQGADFDIGLTGFSDDEIADLFADGTDSEAKDDDYDLTAALEKAAFVLPGDIWTVGRHRLMCGDATNADDVAALMDGKKANLIVTDPPYNCSYQGSSGMIPGLTDRNFISFCSMRSITWLPTSKPAARHIYSMLTPKG